jgi:hypothetical protein
MTKHQLHALMRRNWMRLHYRARPLLDRLPANDNAPVFGGAA